MPAEQEQRRLFILAKQLRLILRIIEGQIGYMKGQPILETTALAQKVNTVRKQQKWVAFLRMRLGCMTCMAMCTNGAKTTGMRIIKVLRRMGVLG